MPPQTFRSLLIRFFTVPVAALALLALGLTYAVTHLELSARLIDHTDAVLVHDSRLLRLFVDEETGVRGFLLQPDPLLLAPYNAALPSIVNEFSLLAHLTADNPGQSQRLAEVHTLYDAWHTDNLAAISTKTPTPAKPIVYEQKRGLDRLRGKMNAIVEEEATLREQRTDINQRWSRTTLVSLFLFAGLAAAVIVWNSWDTFREISALYEHQLREAEGARQEVFQRKEWLNVTLRSIGDGVIACDPEGRVVFMNTVAEELTGWREEEAAQTPLNSVFQIVNETSRKVVESPADKVLRMGTVVGLANHTVLIRKDKSELNIDDSGAPIRDSGGQIVGVVLVFRDISQRRLVERALIRAEKLASAGRLSAAIAHEVNNPLEALSNLVYLARSEDDGERRRGFLEQAEAEVGRISHITKQSLGFYKESLGVAPFLGGEVVRETVTFYEARASLRRIDLKARVQSEIEMTGLAGEMRQILSNLVSNSLDATTSGGRIQVHLKRTRAVDNPAMEYATFTVTDSGAGIPVTHLNTVFEPFFTTKTNTGTGLGLWVTRELVERHGGTIQLRSRTSGSYRGTLVQIKLPTVSPASRSEAGQAAKMDEAQASMAS